MNPKIKDKKLDLLFEGVLLLKSVEECYGFFEDLCTIAELKAMEQRFTVAKMLDTGAAYGDIAEKTSASSATISRVNRALNYGNDGYRTVFERLKENGSI